jgi:hypothetical protein
MTSVSKQSVLSFFGAAIDNRIVGIAIIIIGAAP